MWGLGHFPAELTAVLLASGDWSRIFQSAFQFGETLEDLRIQTERKKIHWLAPKVRFPNGLLP